MRLKMRRALEASAKGQVDAHAGRVLFSEALQGNIDAGVLKADPSTLSWLVKSLFDCGRGATALKMLRKTGIGGLDTVATLQAIRELIRRGEDTEALQWLETKSSSILSMRDDLLLEVAREQARRGFVPDAYDTIDKFGAGLYSGRLAALAAIAEAEQTGREFPHEPDWIHRLKEPSERSWAYLGAARGRMRKD